MSAPYLVEVRTAGDLKTHLRTIIHDVADEYGLTGVSEPRAVPHMTLFGPYDTSQPQDVKDALTDVLEGYSIVPYCINGFDTFPENNVVYADVDPSEELRALRRDISRRLRPLCSDYRPWDEDYFYDYHITIAYQDVTDEQLTPIMNYVSDHYELQADAYATRVSNLTGSNMMWEYDLPTSTYLSSEAATSRSSWSNTEAALERQQSSDDHTNCGSSPAGFRRLGKSLKVRATGQW